jgi:tetratricopeptide (TPR) repeat protein
MIRPIRLIIAAMMTASVACAADEPKSEKPAAPPVPALEKENAANYRLCLSTARSYPEQGFELAGRWEGLGGGEPAKHCAAVALIGLREYPEAAKRLTALALSSKQSADIRAGMLAQAGQAWFLAGNSYLALETQTAALKIVPEKTLQAADILIDRAQTEADAKKYNEAVADLTAALAIDPYNAEAYTFRANAYHDMDRNEAALADAEKAVATDNNNAGAHLMRGILYLAAGRSSEARQDWMKVLELAPDSDAAKAAQHDIESLDVEVKSEPEPEKKKKK